MTRRGAFDAALVIAVGSGWGLLAPATKALFLATPSAFDGVTVAISRAANALPGATGTSSSRRFRLVSRSI